MQLECGKNKKREEGKKNFFSWSAETETGNSDWNDWWIENNGLGSVVESNLFERQAWQQKMWKSDFISSVLKCDIFYGKNKIVRDNLLLFIGNNREIHQLPKFSLITLESYWLTIKFPYK